MNPSYVAAGVMLLSAGAAAAAMFRRGRDSIAFACLVAAPVLAALPIAFWPGGAPTSARDPRVGSETSGGPAAAGGGATRGESTPADAARQRGTQARIARDFATARDAFAELVRLDLNDADAWADLADATAAAANGDLSTGADALRKALQLNPDHPKALWLQATLELQRKDYAAAAKLWEHLLAVVPPGTNDARVVAANLEEARALARGGR